MKKSPREKCLISPRIFIEKGWGMKRKETVPPLVNERSLNHKPEEQLVGEIFVYDETDKPSVPFSHDFFTVDPKIKVETVKLLYIAKGKKISLHFHIKKREIFFLVKGSLEIILISDGVEEKFTFHEGDTLYIAPGMVHQMKGMSKENILLEVSSKDEAADSYRIKKGD